MESVLMTDRPQSIVHRPSSSINRTNFYIQHYADIEIEKILLPVAENFHH